ncbi:MAG: response regulator, partial [Cycloclasticus pugetii]
METMNVLMVEDDEDIGEMLQLSLQTNNIEVTWCKDVMRAQESLRDTTPDIILLDWMLPGISGPDWIKFLKNQEENRCPIEFTNVLSRAKVIEMKPHIKPNEKT